MNEKKLTIAESQAVNAPSLPAASRSWPYLAYFLGVPLAVAVYAALNNWEIRQVAGVSAALLFYMAHALLPWLITCLSTTLAKRALARWQPPWALLLLLGHTLGSVLVVPYSNWLTALYEVRFPALDMAGEVSPLFSTGFWMYFLRAGVIWLGINVLFDRFLHLHLYRYPGHAPRQRSAPADALDTAPEQSTALPPAFLSRLPEVIDVGDLVAIKAEQHYIQVITRQKQFMVLYRFSDAIRELDPDLGVQVHRSYWVNVAAIETVHAKAKDFFLHMQTGLDVPVSGPYQGMMRELARARGIPQTH
ncbi:MAG: LytTR family DNA-binding domain-containing protein [Gammaproteobacteria bacterium]|jgi:hypothetical protein|nr:LytTR family DNA-binding domain-containing protein [Gammaproteobacteria bacterium]